MMAPLRAGWYTYGAMQKRRHFLSTVTAAAVGSVGTLGLGCGGDPATVTPVDVGPASDYSAQGMRLLLTEELIVARDPRGLYAMTARCVHERCVVRPSPGMVCPPPVDDVRGAVVGLCCHCHGSEYSAEGVPQSGPAAGRGNLAQYRVAVEGGRVIVYRGERVTMGTRTG